MSGILEKRPQVGLNATPPGEPPETPPGLAAFQFAWALYAITLICFEFPRSVVDLERSYQLRTLAFISSPGAIAARVCVMVSIAVLALRILSRPGNLSVFCLLNALIVGFEAGSLPYLPNHAVSTLIAGLTILALYAPHLLSQAVGGAPSAETLWTRTRALLGFQLLAMYFFCVFHKLNADFFDPAVSCAGFLIAEMNWLWGDLIPATPAVLALTIYGTLAIETAIPVMLAIPSTRMAGIALGFAFHAVLAMHPIDVIMCFSSMLYALYLLFLPAGVAARLPGSLRAYRRPIGLGLLAWLALAAAVLVAAALYGRTLRTLGLPRFAFWNVWWVCRITWMAVNLILFAVVCHAYRAATTREPARIFRPAALAHPALVLVVLTLVNGFMPYLGLYSKGTWSMFSNLKVEGGGTNHLIVPDWTRIFGAAGDVYLVGDSSHSGLRSAARRRYQVPMIEIRRLLGDSDDPGRFVEIARPGEPFRRITFVDEPGHEAFSPLPTWRRYLFILRSVPQDGEPCDCIH